MHPNQHFSRLRRYAPALIYLPNEAFRIIRSWPPDYRLPIRLARITGNAIRPSVVLQFISLGLFIAVLFGIPDSLLGSVSGIDFVVLGAAVALLIASLRRYRNVRILPFRSPVKGGDREQIEPIITEFAEALHGQMLRISDLVRQDPFREPVDVVKTASRRGEAVRRSPTREPFRTGLPAAGMPVDMKVSDVGTVTMGPFRLQVGILVPVIAWLTRLFGRTLQGTLLMQNEHLIAVVNQSGPHGGSWTVQTDVEDGDIQKASAQLARELAHRMELDRPGKTASGADVHSFEMLVNGLECYQNFLLEGKLHDLDRAEVHFRGAVVHSPRYAAAYHNLGLAKSERDRVYQDLQLRTSPATSAETILWQQAVKFDPLMAPARFQLARFALAQVEETQEEKRRIRLLETALHSACQALAFPSGSHVMERSVARYWIGVTQLRYGMEKKSASEVRKAIRNLRRAERDLSDERAKRLIVDGNETAVAPLVERIASLIAKQAESRVSLAELGRGPGGLQLKMAEHRMRAAMKWGIDNAYLHYQHGQILERLSKPDQAHDAYMAALQSDPHHRESLKAVARILSEGQTGDLAEVAVIIFLLAAHQDPYDPDPWLALAQYLRSRGEMPEALGFAGVGFALAPTNNDVREQMSELYSGWSSSQNSTRLQFAAAAGAAFYKRLAVGGDETSAQMLNRNGKPSLRQRWVSSWSRIQSAITANGDVAVMRDGIREIEELYTRWAAIIPEMRHATWLIGLAHRHLASLLPSSIEKREHRKRAVDCLEMAIERGLPGGYPVPPLWRCELADSQAELGDAYREIRMESEAVRPYEGAISNYEKLIRKQPSAVIHIHASRGPTEIVGDPPRLPVQARAFAGRAEVYAATGRASDSAMDCYEALRLAPLYAYPRFTLARIYREWGQYESAVINLSRLIELDPPGDDRVRARTELARIYRMQAQDGRANEQRVKLLDRSLSELMELTREPFPSKSLDAELHEEIADILLLLGRVDEAIIILRASTDQSGRSYDGLRHARLANLMAQRVQPEEIEQELNIAQTACINEINRKKGTDEEKKLRDELVELTTQLALFYADQQVKIDEAHWAADGALEKARGPAQLSMCFDTYGWVAYQEGNPKAAIRYLEAALKHSGGEARQWAHLAFALEARSTLPRARRLAYSRTRDLDRARDVWLHIVNHFPASDWSCTAKEHLDRIPEHTHLPMPLVHMDRIARTRARSRASRTVDKTY